MNGPSKSSPQLVQSVNVRIVRDGRDGLLAWASCVYNNSLRLDNIAVRRGYDSGLFLTFPARRGPDGKSHSYYFPISTEAAKAIEDAIFSQLAILARAASEGEEF